jgi:phage terminase large subunit-like protein
VITLQKQTNLPIKPIKTIKNKIERFQVALAPHFENGKVFLRADMLDLKQELLSLPFGKHDDMCDSLTFAIQMSSEYEGEPIIDFL